MLTAFDDIPLHQIPRPFAHVVDGDRRWFDRYWFVAYDPEGSVAVATGIGVYKNMNVLDGFASVVSGHTQHNVRVSRALRPDLTTIGAGPLHIEVIEGLRSFRLLLDDNDHGLSLDLTWTATFPAVEEDHHFRRVDGIVHEDFLRFYQWGTVTGHVTVDGTRHGCGSGWFGFRDRSWGVRPGVGGPSANPIPPPGGSDGSDDPTRRAALTLGCAFATDDTAGVFVHAEDADGTRLSFDGQLVPAGGPAGAATKLAGVEHDLELFPGTCAIRRGSLVLRTEDGDRIPFEVERLTDPLVYAGFGYLDGFDDRLGLGVPRGALHIEGDRYDVSHPERVIDLSGARDFSTGLVLREHVLRVHLDGRPGTGDAIAPLLPSHRRYGPRRRDAGAKEETS